MSAMNIFLHHSIQPLQMETNRGFEDGVWLPMWQDNTKKKKKKGLSRNPLTLSNVFVNVQFHIPADPKNARLGNITARAITTILTSVQFLPSLASAGSIFYSQSRCRGRTFTLPEILLCLFECLENDLLTQCKLSVTSNRNAELSQGFAIHSWHHFNDR